MGSREMSRKSLAHARRKGDFFLPSFTYRARKGQLRQLEGEKERECGRRVAAGAPRPEPGRARTAPALAVPAPTSRRPRANPPWQPYQRSMNPLARNPVRSIKRLASDLHSLCTGGAP